MNISRFDEMTWPEIDKMDKKKAIVLIPLSPIEEHGPHLPLGTDVLGARDIAEKAAGLLQEKDSSIVPVLMPAIPIGCSGVTGDFPGTISLRGNTLASVVEDICASLARHGFRYIVFSNHHLDPIHVKAIITGINRVKNDYNIKIIETASLIIYSGMATDELKQWHGKGLDMEKEVHADVKETSFIMYRYPELLKGIYKDLPPSLIDVSDGFRNGKTTFKAMGADDGYIGTPSLATEEMGRLHLEDGARLTAELAYRLIKDEKLPEIGNKMQYYLDNIVKLD